MPKAFATVLIVMLALCGLLNWAAWPFAKDLHHHFVGDGAINQYFVLAYCAPYLIYLTFSLALYTRIRIRFVGLDYKWPFRMFGWTVMHFVPRLVFIVLAVIYLLLDALNMPGAIGVLVGALVVSTGLFLLILHGLVLGKFKWTLKKKELTFDHLPEAFEGFELMQISDAHLGGFHNTYKPVHKAIDIMNELEPDLIVFTGDLVNNAAEEAAGWEDVFDKLKAKHGIYSILGNHDYGDYIHWDSDEAKKENFEELKKTHERFGFQLLTNSHVTIEKENDSFVLAGVENWGLPPFTQHGDIGKALAGADKNAFTIMLSHDPSHWDEQITEKTNIALTLSGHTHGMQFGFDFGNWKWSPVKYKYPKWSGLYQTGKQYLYVNRGFGVLGFPGRVGMWPEITLITLRRSKA